MNKKLNTTAIEYQYRVRQQAKARTKRFREEQEKRGYKNLTVYLSEPFRDELKRLSDEKGLNRQAAMDHIFGIYQHAVIGRVTNNVISTSDKSVEKPVNIESLGVLEEKAENQAEKIEEPAPGIEPKPETPDKAMVDQGKESAKPIRECQDKMFDDMPDPEETKPEKDIDLPDYLIGVDPNMPIEERDKIIMQMAKDFPRGKGIPQKRIDMLNAAGILLDGKPWDKTKQFTDQLSRARGRAKKQETKK